MISQIHGRLAYKSPDEIVIDVHGVGYGIKVPLSTFYELPGIGEEVLLLIHTYVREDSLHLYGFLTPKEKELFRLLIGVSGVGPKLAINVLSGISAEELERALKGEDLIRLTHIPGIGRKTAERMLVELKDKVVVSEAAVVLGIRGKDEMIKDALSALVNLGYAKGIAEGAIKGVLQEKEHALSLEELLRESLRLLARY
jgi:Holliday junction DNA helicase RuvA